MLRSRVHTAPTLLEWQRHGGTRGAQQRGAFAQHYWRTLTIGYRRVLGPRPRARATAGVGRAGGERAGGERAGVERAGRERAGGERAGGERALRACGLRACGLRSRGLHVLVPSLR
eukprot:1162849-Prymnesium_polylepis.1